MIKYRDLIDAGNEPKKLKTRFMLFAKLHLRNTDLKEVMIEYGPYQDPYMITGWLDAVINISEVRLNIFQSVARHYL